MLRPKCTRPRETVLGTRWSLQPDCQEDHARNGERSTRVGGQMETAKKEITTRLNPRWCSPNDADNDYKVMELLRPAVLGCCDSLGVHWSGAWLLT